jgi:hypothetical protein
MNINCNKPQVLVEKYSPYSILWRDGASPMQQVNFGGAVLVQIGNKLRSPLYDAHMGSVRMCVGHEAKMTIEGLNDGH